MSEDLIPAPQKHGIATPSNDGRLLTRDEFYGLAEVPPEVEWFADIQNPNTRRAYAKDVSEFRIFLEIEELVEFRIVRRPHILAWRKELEPTGERSCHDQTQAVGFIEPLFVPLRCQCDRAQSGERGFPAEREIYRNPGDQF